MNTICLPLPGPSPPGSESQGSTANADVHAMLSKANEARRRAIRERMEGGFMEMETKFGKVLCLNSSEHQCPLVPIRGAAFLVYFTPPKAGSPYAVPTR